MRRPRLLHLADARALAFRHPAAMKPDDNGQRQWHSEFKMLRGHLRARQGQASAEATAAASDQSSLDAQTRP